MIVHHGTTLNPDTGQKYSNLNRERNMRGCKVMEHWNVVQPVSDKMANSNGML
jgi:predicted SnoaL-like aldol condensation-catalyzing enzyme